jgi:hypothetical protein
MTDRDWIYAASMVFDCVSVLIIDVVWPNGASRTWWISLLQFY